MREEGLEIHISANPLAFNLPPTATVIAEDAAATLTEWVEAKYHCTVVRTRNPTHFIPDDDIADYVLTYQDVALDEVREP